MKKLLFLLALLWASAASAQVTQGPLLIQRNLGEIADQGSGVQAAARANLGISGSGAIPTAPLLGGLSGSYTVVTPDSTLTLSGGVLGANVGTSGAKIPLLNGNNIWSGTNSYSGSFQANGNPITFPTLPATLTYMVGPFTNGDCLTASGTLGGIVDAGIVCGGGGGGGGGTVTAVSLTAPNIFSVAGSPVTSAGTLALSLANQNANQGFLGPVSGSPGAPTFRALVGADLPLPSSTALGGVQSFASVSHQWINTISTAGVPASSQPACADISNAGTACQANTGTSGAVVPLLSTANAWGAAQTLPNPVFTGTAPGAGTVLNLMGLPVQNFGAVCDGATDDTAAFNAASAYARANYTTGKSSLKLFLPKNVTCVLKGSWDMTFFNSRPGGHLELVTIDGQGSVIDCQQTAQPCIDMLGSGNMQFQSLTINGNPSFTPTIGLFRGSAVDGQGTGGEDFQNMNFTGTFSQTADYNRGGEEIRSWHTAMYVNTPHAIIQDGVNHFNFTSRFTSGMATRGYVQKATIGGTTFNSGDTVSVTFTNAALPHLPVTVTYTLGAGETAATVATGLIALINSSPALAQAGVSSALVSGSTIGFFFALFAAPGYAVVITNSVTGTGNESVTLDSSFHVGDTVSLTFTDASVAGLPVTVTHTVGANELGSTIAAAMNVLINANSTLTTAGINSIAQGALTVVHYSGASLAGTMVLTSAVSGTGSETTVVGVTVDEAKTFNGNHYVGVAIINNSSTGDCLWLARSYRLEFDNSYCASFGPQAVTIGALAVAAPRSIKFDMHIEPREISTGFLFTGGGSGMFGFRYHDPTPNPVVSIFKLDVDTASMAISDFDLDLGADINSGVVVFDQPSVYTIDGPSVTVLQPSMWNGVPSRTAVGTLCTPACTTSPINNAVITGSQIVAATQLQETGTLAFPATGPGVLDNNTITSALTGTSNNGQALGTGISMVLTGTGSGTGQASPLQVACVSQLSSGTFGLCSGLSGQIANIGGATLTNAWGVYSKLISNTGTISELDQFTTIIGSNAGTISLLIDYKCPVQSGGWGAVTVAHCVNNLDPAKDIMNAGGYSMGNSSGVSLANFGIAGSKPVHITTAQATNPAVTSCGGGSPVARGTDTAGEITMGTSATGCVMTFNQAYNSVPFCAVTWENTPLAVQSYSVSATALTLVQTSTSGNKASFHCIAPLGG